jgi:hypothetical protein
MQLSDHAQQNKTYNNPRNAYTASHANAEKISRGDR